MYNNYQLLEAYSKLVKICNDDAIVEFSGPSIELGILMIELKI